MSIRIYQLDAFTDQLFAGNPAAVCPLAEWLPDETMQQIAAENNLAETAFYVRSEGENQFHIRWFTPTVEVDLCGHATLAASHVIFFEENSGVTGDKITLDSRSGPLHVCRQQGNNGTEWLVLDFPADEAHKANLQPPALLASLAMSGSGSKPVEILKGKTDYMVVYETQSQIESLTPDFREMVTVPARGIIVTGPGDDCDFVSRFFGPQSGIDEDPVTGSAHTTLVPYWAEKLGKTELTARQVSRRGGYLKCKLNTTNPDQTRVDIAGQVKLYLKGEIEIR